MQVHYQLIGGLSLNSLGDGAQGRFGGDRGWKLRRRRQQRKGNLAGTLLKKVQNSEFYQLFQFS